MESQCLKQALSRGHRPPGAILRLRRGRRLHQPGHIVDGKAGSERPLWHDLVVEREARTAASAAMPEALAGALGIAAFDDGWPRSRSSRSRWRQPPRRRADEAADRRGAARRIADDLVDPPARRIGARRGSWCALRARGSRQRTSAPRVGGGALEHWPGHRPGQSAVRIAAPTEAGRRRMRSSARRSARSKRLWSEGGGVRRLYPSGRFRCHQGADRLCARQARAWRARKRDDRRYPRTEARDNFLAFRRTPSFSITGGFRMVAKAEVGQPGA